MKSVKTLKIAVFAAVAVIAGGAWAQNPNLPNTINVPVTYYDFRSDRSNPEFEQPHDSRIQTYGQTGLRTGMVAERLDADNKPQIGPRPYRNYGIAHWFRDWSTYMTGRYSRGTNIAPSYTPTPGIRQRYDNEWGANVVYNGDINVGHDTSFKNIVIRDELVFQLSNAATGMYEFARRSGSGGQPFFPLNNRGFGNEWRSSVEGGAAPNNYSFTMELEFGFQVRADMVFNFAGDDDVWVFINDRLVLDLGGIHEEISGSFNLNDFSSWLPTGQNATLRIFYAERHSDGSNIRIQTNIIAPPSSIGISTSGNSGGNVLQPGQSIEKPADESRTLYSVVYDENGLVLVPGVDYNCDHVTWVINNREVGRGCAFVVADSVAGALNITVTYNNRVDPPVNRNATVNVKALRPASIHIQRSDAAKDPLTDRNFSDNIYFAPGEERTDVYAVLYDRYGNKVGMADRYGTQNSANDWWSDGAAVWTSMDPEVATVNPNIGSRVLVTKEAMGAGTEGLMVVVYEACQMLGGSRNCITLTDTVGVGSRSTGAITVGPNPFTPGRTQISEIYKNTPEVLRFYDRVIRNTGGGTGRGILIAVDAPAPIVPGPGTGGSTGDLPHGKIIIYDAVGNVVRRDALYQAGARSSYGYVWDGKNTNGRYVGPGTYLVRISGRDTDGKAISVQRKIGVTK